MASRCRSRRHADGEIGSITVGGTQAGGRKDRCQQHRSPSDDERAARPRGARGGAREEARRRRCRSARARRQRAHGEGPARPARARARGGQPRARPARASRRASRDDVHQRPASRRARRAVSRDRSTLAELAEPDECALPPDPTLLATSFPELDLYDPAVAEVDAAWALKQAIAGEAAARKHDKRVTNSEGATWSRVLGGTAFATSRRILRRLSRQLCVARRRAAVRRRRASRQSEEAQRLLVDRRRGSSRRSSRPKQVGIEAARRTVATLGSRKVDDRKSARSCSIPRSRARSSARCSRSRTARRSGASRRYLARQRRRRWSLRRSSRSSMIR